MRPGGSGNNKAQVAVILERHGRQILRFEEGRRRRYNDFCIHVRRGGCPNADPAAVNVASRAIIAADVGEGTINCTRDPSTLIRAQRVKSNGSMLFQRVEEAL